MKIIDLAWQKVKSSTINCFAKARTLKEQQKSAQPAEDDLFKDLSNKTEKLWDFHPPGTTTEGVISGDENLMSK